MKNNLTMIFLLKCMYKQRKYIYIYIFNLENFINLKQLNPITQIKGILMGEKI